MAVAPVLHTRLLPSRLPPDCLPRADLTDRVLAGLAGRLVAVLAGAGYGKSTLLAQALARLDVPWVWCSCDARMTEPAALVAHLAVGLADRFPGFGAELEFRGSAQEQVAALCNEIALTVDEDLVVALDDVHTLPDATAEALSLLVSDLPPQAHLALAGRSPLPFPLGRARAARALELGPRDLALSEEEAQTLLRAAGQDLDAVTLAEVHRQSEGWVTGLILASQVSAVDLREALASGRLFEYLAEEVFLAQPPELQRFLLDTAVLERFTPELAAAVSGNEDSSRVCRDLVRRHLFTIRLQAEGEWYRYHHLFQAFLRVRLREDEAHRIGELHDRAARAWRSAGEPLEAVHHHLDAGAYEQAVDVLEPLAEDLVATPHGDQVARWLEAIPRALWQSRPGLVLAQASLLFARGDYDAMLSALERALEQLLEAGEQERAATALFRLFQALMVSGAHHERAIEVAERYLPRVDPRASKVPMVRLALASRYGYAGRFEDAEGELAKGSVSPPLAIYAGVVRAYYIDHAQGRSREALATLDGAVPYEQDQLGDDVRMDVMEAVARTARGIVLIELGRSEEGLAEAARIMEFGARRNMRGVVGRPAGWVRLSALADLHHWDELEAELQPSFRFPPAGTLYGYRYRGPAALLAAHRGDREATAEQVRAGLAALRAYGPVFEAASTLASLAIAARAAGLADLTREVLDEMEAAVARHPTPWWQARAALIAALCRGASPRGDEHLADALELTARNGVPELWARKERRHAAPLLSRAIERGLGPAGVAGRLAAACGGEVLAEVAERVQDAPAPVRAQLAEAAGEAAGVDAELIERLLRDRDADVREAARRSRRRIAARPRPPLAIHSLGGFAVRRGELTVPAAAFGRQRARALLAALLCARGPVHREELLEWFWPELPPARGLRALAVTLHGLRRALEPELARGAAASVILADGETYRVALVEGDRWDAGAFLELARAGALPDEPERRLERLRAAEAAYTGALFPEWPYAEWAQARREEVEQARRQVLEQLGALSLELGRAVAAIAPYQALVALEPERERWHRGLMQAYERAGERALALRQYHACRKVMRSELGVEPSAETRALYRELLGGPVRAGVA